jgi:hypothetical protein
MCTSAPKSQAKAQQNPKSTKVTGSRVTIASTATHSEVSGKKWARPPLL